MKLILLISIMLSSFLCFSKGGGGGGSHSSSGGHSLSHSESGGHESSSHESSSHESASAGHPYSPSASRTYFVQPNGIYWMLLLNNHTNKMDTIRASSKEELDNKVNELSDCSLTNNQIWWIFAGVICCILGVLYLNKV